MIVLGVDPSSTSAGFGVLDVSRRHYRFIACGCIRPRRSDPFEDRLVTIFDKLRDVVAEHAPEEAAIESTFFGKDAGAAARLGEARGVLLVALRLAGLPVAHYTPAQVKKAVAGNGQASKEQVQFMVTRLLGLAAAPRPLDASDALAIALCHACHRPLAAPAASGGRRPEIDALLRRMTRR